MIPLLRAVVAVLAAPALAAALTAPAAAQWKDWDYQLDQEKKPWSEMQAQLPPYPKAENLLPFETTGATRNQFFLDAPSLSVGEDGVVRYTMVVKTSGGATNVSFEGIRCDARQLRVYAFGRVNGEWSRARNAGWREILPNDLNAHHYALHRDYVCTRARTSEPRSVKEIVTTLKRGPLPAPGI